MYLPSRFHNFQKQKKNNLKLVPKYNFPNIILLESVGLFIMPETETKIFHKSLLKFDCFDGITVDSRHLITNQMNQQPQWHRT